MGHYQRVHQWIIFYTDPLIGVKYLLTSLTQWSHLALAQTGFTLFSNTCGAYEVSYEMFKGELLEPGFCIKKEGLRIYYPNIVSLLQRSKHWFIYHRSIPSIIFHIFLVERNFAKFIRNIISHPSKYLKRTIFFQETQGKGLFSFLLTQTWNLTSLYDPQKLET